MRFIGDFGAKSDNKGRVFLPVYFRRILEQEGCDRLMLRKDVYQDCLVLYPEESWNQQLDLLRSRLDKWNTKHQMIFRQFVADVEELSLDSNGRILLNKRKKEYANIKQDVRFLAVDDKIEIWDKTLYEDMLGISGEQNDNLGLDLQNLMTDLQ